MKFCCIALSSLALGAASGELRGKQWYGYWEDWCNEDVDVTWYDDNTPGHCDAGCVIETSFHKQTASCSIVAYAFSTLLRQPNADQDDCSAGCLLWIWTLAQLFRSGRKSMPELRKSKIKSLFGVARWAPIPIEKLMDNMAV